MNWTKYPFFRLLFPYIFGLYLGRTSPAALDLYVSIPIFLAALALALYNIRQRGKPWHALLLLSLFALGGYIYASEVEKQLMEAQQNQVLPAKALYSIRGKAGASEYSLRYYAALESYSIDSGTWQQVQESSWHLLRIPVDSLSLQIEYGDKVLVEAEYHAFSEAQNPESFDLRRYYQSKGLLLEAKVHRWKKMEGEFGGYWLWHWLEGYRKYWGSVLYEHIQEPLNRDLALALILGQRQGMQRELLNAYMDTGAMHVLAVSGLHVGLIAMVFQFLLWRIAWRNRFWFFSRLLLLLSAIWLFALLTGASASVLRAALMFSLLQLALYWKQPNSSYNCLAGSAFLLLTYNPLYLWDLGFQLSHVAVWGILYFYKPIHKLYYSRFAFLRWMWQMLAVSLAAQLATLPLCLYHFHQFPIFFWLAGWIVLPLASVILPLGIAFLLLHAVPYLGAALAFLLNILISWMNGAVFLVSKLPSARLEGFYLSDWEYILSYILLFSFAWYMKNKRILALRLTLSLALLLSVGQAWQVLQAQEQIEICFFNNRKESCWQFTEGQKGHLLLEGTGRQTEDYWIGQMKRNYDFSRRIQTEQRDSFGSIYQGQRIVYEPPLLLVDSLRFFVLDTETWEELAGKSPPEQALQVDYLLLKDYIHKFDLEVLNTLIEAEKAWIFDNAWRSYALEKQVTLCDSLGIRQYSIERDGAWLWKL